ncbi:MAG: ATP-binding protein [Nitrospirota bacterium]
MPRRRGLRFYRSLPFQKKLLIFMMAMVIFMGGVMGLLIRFIIFPYLTREMEARGMSVAHRLAENARTYMVTRDTVRLTGLLFDEKYREENIAYIMATDVNDQVLAHTFVGMRSEEAAVSLLSSSAWADDGGSLLDRIPKNDISRVAIPVKEGFYQIGTIRIGLDRRFIHTLINKLGLFHLVSISLLTLGGLGFALYLSRVVTKPISTLTNLAEQISQGNLDTHISFDLRRGCWELLMCEATDCPAYGNNTVQCWFVDHTKCKDAPVSTFPEKLDTCRDCVVYRTQMGDEIIQLGDSFNHMTQRMRASERELRLSEKRYRFLFNNDPNSLFVIALESYTVRDANDRALERYGYPREKLLGMKFTDLGVQEGTAQVEAALAELNKRQSSCTFLTRIRHKNLKGSTFWVNINFCSFEYLGEQGVIATTTDVTEVVDTEAKLIQAGKMATLGEMSAGVAHELSQPLNTIKIGSDFLQTMVEKGRAISEGDLKEVAKEMSTQVDRAASIITHLREFGRQREMVRTEVHVNGPICEVLGLLGRQLTVHGIEVVADIDETLPPILADTNRLEQVLINLITNARDAMDKKKELGGDSRENRLTIRAFPERDRVTVTVSDTGTGIAETIRGRIFDPFFTTKEVGKGTGLGLAISYGIVTDLNGTIDFESKEGVGTTFRLTFPRAQEEERHGPGD